MTYTRKSVCALTGMRESELKTLMRRDQLPVISGLLSSQMRDEETRSLRGWTRFTALDIVAIAVAKRLAERIGYADGLGPETAAKISLNNRLGVDEALRQRGPDLWLGYLGFGEYRGAPGGGANLSGTLEEVTAEVAAGAARGTHSPLRLFLVNVSEIVREIRKRAAQLNLEFGAED